MGLIFSPSCSSSSSSYSSSYGFFSLFSLLFICNDLDASPLGYGARNDVVFGLCWWMDGTKRRKQASEHTDMHGLQAVSKSAQQTHKHLMVTGVLDISYIHNKHEVAIMTI
ncbi:uncharacterized protein IWZ02DRAFT_458606 [Phyllosticta citriasiana]|uniref:uncharacterized protein n=1 Tax=Phyllosticta citriasiana TaxID=595635 RepID=UPI0030FDDD06